MSMNSSSTIIAGGNPWPHPRPYSAWELAAHLHPMNLFEVARRAGPGHADGVLILARLNAIKTTPTH